MRNETAVELPSTQQQFSGKVQCSHDEANQSAIKLQSGGQVVLIMSSRARGTNSLPSCPPSKILQSNVHVSPFIKVDHNPLQETDETLHNAEHQRIPPTLAAGLQNKVIGDLTDQTKR
jgi:hypothetical protein